MRLFTVSLALVLLLVPDRALPWEASIDGAERNESDSVGDLATDPSGDLIVAGSLRNGGTTDDDFAVVKLSRGAGRELWRREIDGTYPFINPGNKDDRANAVTTDFAGDVFAAGSFRNDETNRDFGVVKLSGESGEILWRQDINGTASNADSGSAVAVDAVGDVVAGGSTGNGRPGADFTVVKLSGTNGQELWRLVLIGTGEQASGGVTDIIVDSNGDVFAVGVTENAGTSQDWTVVKVNGADGTELWRQIIDGTANGGDNAAAVGLDSTGNALVAGSLENVDSLRDFTVIKFAGIDGTELWRFERDGLSSGASDAATAMAVDGAGDVVATGEIRDANGLPEFAVVKLSGTDGSEVWSRDLLSPTGVQGRDVLVDGVGDVFAAGKSASAETGEDWLVAKLSGADGAVLWLEERDFGGGAELRYAAIDTAGDITVTGSRISNRDGYGEIGVLKLSGTDGSDYFLDTDGDGVPDDEDCAPEDIDRSQTVVEYPDDDVDDVRNSLVGATFCVTPGTPPSSGTTFNENGPDNCPENFNPIQEDGDGDLVGDACDPFPNDANNRAAQCEVELDECLSNPPSFADADGDGEHDRTDLCPGTPGGAKVVVGATVDTAGCSQAQFCALVDASTSNGRRACRASDWKNDEPLARPGPGDCEKQGGLCVPAAP